MRARIRRTAAPGRAAGPESPEPAAIFPTGADSSARLETAGMCRKMRLGADFHHGYPTGPCVQRMDKILFMSLVM